MIFKKHFTVAEANELLPTIQPKLAQIADLKVSLDRKGYDVYKHQYFGGLGPNGQKYFPLEMERLVTLVRELSELGIELKDFSSGLIDFPFLRPNGEEVFLCYKLGEAEVTAWHSLEGGFRSRQSVDEL